MHHPVGLGRHGKTPSGEPLFRVVWSDSRRQSEEFNGKMYHDQPFYPLTVGKWILEKWLNPEQYTRMTPHQYADFEATALNGKAHLPYPEDGEYECIEIFDGTVDEEAVERALSHHTHRLRNKSLAEREHEVLERADVREKAVDDLYEAELSKAFGDSTHE